MSRLWRPACLLVAIAMLATGCSSVRSGRIVVTATFDDVFDLVTRAQVRAGDVPIGSIDKIDLTADHRALVTMQVDTTTGLTLQSEAIISRTTLLGERYIELRPLLDDAGEPLPGPALQDGDHLTITQAIDDLEEIVVAGSDLLAVVAAGQLAAAVRTGAEAFGGQSGLIGQFLDSVGGVIGRYQEDVGVITDLLDSLDDLTAEMAPDAEANAAALDDVLAASEALRAEDTRLLDTLADVRRLANVGTDVMRENATNTDRAIRRLRQILAQITRFEGALQTILTWLPVHNINVPNGSIAERAQVWLDFQICGLNDDPNDPSEACEPSNPGETNSPRPDNATRAEDTDTTPPPTVSGDEPENQGGTP